MQHLDTYIAFDLEFNTVNDVSHVIQVSAVKYDHHKEVDSFDTYVYRCSLTELYQWPNRNHI